MDDFVAGVCAPADLRGCGRPLRGQLQKAEAKHGQLIARYFVSAKKARRLRTSEPQSRAKFDTRGPDYLGAASAGAASAGAAAGAPSAGAAGFLSAGLQPTVTTRLRLSSNANKASFFMNRSLSTNDFTAAQDPPARLTSNEESPRQRFIPVTPEKLPCVGR